jgi:hypothetical protein
VLRAIRALISAEVILDDVGNPDLRQPSDPTHWISFFCTPSHWGLFNSKNPYLNKSAFDYFKVECVPQTVSFVAEMSATSSWVPAHNSFKCATALREGNPADLTKSRAKIDALSLST